MKNGADGYSATRDEISLVEIGNVVLRHWRLVGTLPVVFASVAILLSVIRAPTYTVSASFMTQGSEGRGPSGAAALAQQFGVSLGPERGGQSPQFYVDLVRSRTLLRKAVETEYQLPTGAGTNWTGTLIEYWDVDEGDGSLASWQRAAQILRDNIFPSVNRETGVVQLTVSSDHPILAERIAARLLELLNDFNLEVRQSRAQEEGRFVTRRMVEAQEKLLVAEGALQDFLRQNREFRNSPELVFEHDRLQRQVLMRQEVYTSLLRSQEQARIDAVRDISLFTVIDHPAGTANPQGQATAMRAALAFGLGIIFAVVLAFVREIVRRSREMDDPHYREFGGLAREAWYDLRHPGRWIPGTRKAAGPGDP